VNSRDPAANSAEAAAAAAASDRPPAFDEIFAGPALRATVSPIARTLELVERTPGMVSFACGNPANEALPVAEIAAACAAALAADPERALQYTAPRGIIQAALGAHLARDGVTAGPAEIMPTTGAIQALALLAHALLREGDVVVTEWPTYPVNLASFRTHGARPIGVPMDEEGMRVDLLDRLLGELAREGRPAKLIYVIPDAQNPTGITMSRGRRIDLVEAAARHGVLVVEDAPYRRLDFAGEPIPPVAALARARFGPEARVALVGSFAKTVAPGLRVGYLVAPPALLDVAVLLKQGEDFCTSGLLQLAISELIQNGTVARQEQRFAAVHGEKLAAMQAALERELAGLPVRWLRPRGGLFVWLALPESADSERILERAIAHRVAFIPSRAFYPPEVVGADGRPAPAAAPANFLRLNFSYPPLLDIPRGVASLAAALREAL
jgi:DNA-binding transcriptional MocR family regulator